MRWPVDSRLCLTVLAWRFKWPPSELERLTAAKLLFWMDRLDELNRRMPQDG